MKYIIEIEDAFISKEGKNPTVLFRAKGFNSLVFDKEGLDKLEPLEGFLYESFDKGYWEGYNDALRHSAEKSKGSTEWMNMPEGDEEKYITDHERITNLENILSKIEAMIEELKCKK